MRPLAYIFILAVLILPFQNCGAPQTPAGSSKQASTPGGTGNIIAASDCSLASVQTAVDSASAGDTIAVPSGQCNWAAPLNIHKAIVLQGAGINSTVINASMNSLYGVGLVQYSPTTTEASQVFEITGFTFDGKYSTGCLLVSPPGPTVAVQNLKIHDNKFVNGNSRAIILSGLEFGVFYKNQFQDNYIAISVIGSEMNGWNFPSALGGSNYPFFEDNTFNQTVARGGFIVETGRGGRIAFRYNTITNYGGAGAEVFDAHGVNGTFPTDTGTVSSEYYKNSIQVSTGTRVFNHRGGKAVFANNAISGAGYLSMTEYQGWSYCTPAAYPKPQQINDSYYWSNSSLNPTLYCTSGACSACGQYDSTFIQANRDYWLPTSGPAANRPVSCAIGSIFSTTDTNTVYKCNSANVWSTVFAPYTYPHPLR